MVDWLVEGHSQFKLLQETLYMTIYVIDKFLQVRFATPCSAFYESKTSCL